MERCQCEGPPHMPQIMRRRLTGTFPAATMLWQHLYVYLKFKKDAHFTFSWHQYQHFAAQIQKMSENIFLLQQQVTVSE